MIFSIHSWDKIYFYFCGNNTEVLSENNFSPKQISELDITLNMIISNAMMVGKNYYIHFTFGGVATR